MKHDVFISYSKRDIATAKSLSDALQISGYSVWWDRSLIPGDDFEDIILAALDESKSVVVLWSEHSANSRWVKVEAGRATERGVLVPVRISKTALPDEFSRFHTGSLIGWAGSTTSIEFQRLLQAVERHAGPARPADSSQRQREFAAAIREFLESDKVLQIAQRHVRSSSDAFVARAKDALVATTNDAFSQWRRREAGFEKLGQATDAIQQSFNTWLHGEATRAALNDTIKELVSRSLSDTETALRPIFDRYALDMARFALPMRSISRDEVGMLSEIHVKPVVRQGELHNLMSGVFLAATTNALAALDLVLFFAAIPLWVLFRTLAALGVAAFSLPENQEKVANLDVPQIVRMAASQQTFESRVMASQQELFSKLQKNYSESLESQLLFQTQECLRWAIVRVASQAKDAL